MSRRVLAVLLLLFALAVPAGAQPSLDQVIVFEEYPSGKRPDPKNPEAPVTSRLDGGLARVDMNSIIKVKVAAPTPTVEEARAVLCKDAASENCSLARAAGALRESADALRVAYTGSIALVQLVSEPNSQAYLDQKNAANRAFDAFRTKALEYQSALQASRDPELSTRGTSFRAQLAQRLRGNANEGDDRLVLRREAIPTFLENEADWLLKKLAERSEELLAERGSRMIRLAAIGRTKRGTQELTLPNYSTVVPGAPSVYEKIRWIPSAEQIAEAKALFAEAKATADAFNKLREEQKNFKNAVREILKQNGVDIEALRDGVDEVVKSLQALRGADLNKVKNDVVAAADKALQNPQLTAAQKTDLDKIKTDFNGVVTSLANAKQGIDNVVARVRALSPDVVTAAVAAQTDPVDALVTFLQSVQGGFTLATGRGKEIDELRAALVAIKPALENAASTAKSLGTLVQGLAPVVTDPALSTLIEQSKTLLQPVSDSVKKLTDQAERIVNFVKMLADLGNKASLDIRPVPPSTSFDVSLLQVQDTWITVQELAGRGPNDTITFQAWLYEIEDPNDPSKRREVGTIAKTFQLLPFGWHTGANVGVAYVTSLKKPPASTTTTDNDETRAFAPQVSWQLRYRPRGSQLFGTTGIGVHTASFDLNKDNGIELGLGLTASFLDDFLYFGFGRNLTESGNYWFVGTRLFQFAQRFLNTSTNTTEDQ